MKMFRLGLLLAATFVAHSASASEDTPQGEVAPSPIKEIVVCGEGPTQWASNYMAQTNIALKTFGKYPVKTFEVTKAGWNSSTSAFQTCHRVHIDSAAAQESARIRGTAEGERWAEFKQNWRESVGRGFAKQQQEEAAKLNKKSSH